MLHPVHDDDLAVVIDLIDHSVVPAPCGRYADGGRWHLFAYRVDATQVTKLDPGYSASCGE